MGYNFYIASAVELVKNYRKTGEQDTSRHNKAKYVVNGPEDITGQQIVKMVEDHIGTQVKDVVYKDVSFIDYMAAQSSESSNVIRSIRHAPETAWAGECTAS